MLKLLQATVRWTPMLEIEQTNSQELSWNKATWFIDAFSLQMTRLQQYADSHFFNNTKMPLGFWQQALKWNKTWKNMEKISDYLCEFKDRCNLGWLASLALFELLSLLIVNLGLSCCVSVKEICHLGYMSLRPQQFPWLISGLARLHPYYKARGSTDSGGTASNVT